MSLDYVYHGRIEPFQIGFVFVSAVDLSNTAVIRHNCDPAAAHVLGRALAAGLLLMPRLGMQERLNLHWRYEGVLRNLLIDLRGDGRIRGLINPPRLGELADSAEELFGGGGFLNSVTSRNGHILNSGTTPCAMQQPTADLGYHLSISEQIESELNVMIAFTRDPARPVSLCQGLLLQAQPGADLIRFDRIRGRLHQPEARSLLGSASAADGLFEDLIRVLLRDEGVPHTLHVEAAPAPRWFCTCSADKFRASIRLLADSDRNDIRQKNEPILVRCDFCNRGYEFSLQDAEDIWAGD
jgi:molecular chaperone Hsp33